MTNQNERFVCILDPCGLWLVWDEARNAPAEAPGLGMVGLSEAEARRRCRYLERRRLQVMSPGERPLGADDEDSPMAGGSVEAALTAARQEALP